MNSFQFEPDVEIRCRDFAVGCIGAGFIMADVHLAAYADAGFKVAAIASRTPQKARDTAERWKIPTVHDTPEQLISDTSVDVIDIAYPPHLQPDLIRQAVRQPHIKAILAQKPITTSYAEALEIVRLCESEGKLLSVNQNMRYDQSMRVLKQILDRDLLGEPVFAEIDMHAIPHWQPFLDDYDRLTLLNMSVHHLDVMRFLFGEVAEIYTATRPDPHRAGYKHVDGICVSSLRFESGVSGVCVDDIFASPVSESFESDLHIGWRVEGTRGVAKGSIGWPDYPEGSPSTLSFASEATDGKWERPEWSTMWFPDAFKGVMEQLQYALHSGEPPALSGADNLKTMALIEAAYRSIAEKRAVSPQEIVEETAG
jgi:predicted dehydrogenase